MNISSVKDRLVLLGWLAGLFAAVALVWILTRPVQERYLMKAVNTVFTTARDGRRLAAPAAAPAGSPPGYWYSMSGSTDRLFVFGIMRDGILIPCGARVSAGGTVDELIPLGIHAAQVLSGLPQGILRIYVRRIEAVFSGGGA